jgi:hypothetical protein
MLKRFSAGARVGTGLMLLLLVSFLAAFAVTAPASASSAAIVVPFEKHYDAGLGHYVGTAGNGGTIAMWVYDSSYPGNVQQFTATLELSLGGNSLTAILDGRLNFSTGRVVLNGVVTDGWLEGARIHEESQLTGFDPITFAGTVQLMPASAN